MFAIDSYKFDNCQTLQLIFLYCSNKETYVSLKSYTLKSLVESEWNIFIACTEFPAGVVPMQTQQILSKRMSWVCNFEQLWLAMLHNPFFGILALVLLK